MNANQKLKLSSLSAAAAMFDSEGSDIKDKFSSLILDAVINDQIHELDYLIRDYAIALEQNGIAKPWVRASSFWDFKVLIASVLD